MTEQEVDSEKTKVSQRLSTDGQRKLQQLKEDLVFIDQVDAYRFSVALGIAYGKQLETTKTKTIFNIGTVDPNGTLRMVISTLGIMDTSYGDIGKTMENLAEWGIDKLHSEHISGGIDFSSYLNEISEVII